MRNRSLLLLTSCFLLFTNSVYCNEKADMYYNSAIKLNDVYHQKEVFELYARSAELGHIVAQYNLAMMYSNGESVYVDYQQAVYWFSKSASQDFPPAQYRLGEMYYFEKGGLPKDLDKAVVLFRQAAELNDPDAQLNLAMLHATGDGLPLDTEKALHWMTQAYRGGNDTALEYKHMLIDSEDGKITADQQERFWLEKAAELGIKEAQQALGMLNAGDTPKTTSP
jgi:TPR repeat protein